MLTREGEEYQSSTAENMTIVQECSERLCERSPRVMTEFSSIFMHAAK